MVLHIRISFFLSLGYISIAILLTLVPFAVNDFLTCLSVRLKTNEPYSPLDLRRYKLKLPMGLCAKRSALFDKLTTIKLSMGFVVAYTLSISKVSSSKTLVTISCACVATVWFTFLPGSAYSLYADIIFAISSVVSLSFFSSFSISSISPFFISPVSISSVSISPVSIFSGSLSRSCVSSFNIGVSSPGVKSSPLTPRRTLWTSRFALSMIVP